MYTLYTVHHLVYPTVDLRRILVVHGTSGSTSYETIPPFVPLESSGGVLSTLDMVVQRRDGPRRLRDHDDDNNNSPIISNAP